MTKKTSKAFAIFRYSFMGLILLYVLPQIFFPQWAWSTYPAFLPTLNELCPFAITDSLSQFLINFKVNFPTIAINLLIMFILLFVTSMLVGRIFCGYICPLGIYQEFLGKIGDYIFVKILKRSKPQLPKKLDEILKYLKFAILLCAILIAVFAGKLIFVIGENSLPVAQLFNPWIAANFLPYSFLLFSTYIVSFISLVLFTVLSIVYDRPFCKYFCMAGALYSIGASVAPLKVKKDDDYSASSEEIILEGCSNALSEEESFSIIMEILTDERNAESQQTISESQSNSSAYSDVQKVCPMNTISNSQHVINDECIMCGKCVHKDTSYKYRFFGLKVAPWVAIIGIILILGGMIALRATNQIKTTIPHEQTLGDYAKSNNMDYAQFMKQLNYSNPKVNKNTTVSEFNKILYSEPLSKVYKLFNLTSVDQIITICQLPATTPKTLSFDGYLRLTKLGVLAKQDSNFSTFAEYKKAYGLPASAKETDTYGMYEKQITKAKDRDNIESMLQNYPQCCVNQLY